MKKNILITGAGGYVGTELSNYLVKKNYNITAVDTFWFGNKLDKKIKIVKSDIRELNSKIFKNIHTVIHLAYLSCDPLCEIDARETWETGPLGLYHLLEGCKQNKIKKFIFASSGSIYGFKKDRKVTETLGLEPLTDYNKSKMICEKVLETYSKNFKIVNLRPGTICGVSKRQRLDLLVNIFAFQAFHKKEIIVNGGKQVRPILHIKDMILAYEFFLKKNISGTFNVSAENSSVYNIAKRVSKIIPCKIKIKKNLDPRSYRMDSSKLAKHGFKISFKVEDAVYDLKKKFSKNFKISDIYWNIKWLLKKKKIFN